jgi:chaperone required for assembly of F1-ATPase
MAEWQLKRFWEDVAVAAEPDGGWTVRLDSRPLSVPSSRSALGLPTRALAEAVAEEWRRQDAVVRPALMPMTRLANTAQDRVAARFEAVAEIVSAFAETDLLCYRAEAPKELVARQAEAWDPLLDWAASGPGARLWPTCGIVPVPQPRDALDRLAAEVRRGSPWRLTALHELVALSGSLVIGLAVEGGILAPEDGWARSRIDEDWQAEQWGRDEEAETAAARRRVEFLDALRFLRLAEPPGPAAGARA